MAASICLNCEKIDQGEDEPCCDAPDLIALNNVPAEIKCLGLRVDVLQARLREAGDRYMRLLKEADDRYMRLLKEAADAIAMRPMIDLGDADRGRAGCGVAPGGVAAPNPEVEEAACYRWLRDNWGRLGVETGYGAHGAPRVVKEIVLLPTLQPVDPKSLRLAILRAMSKEGATAVKANSWVKTMTLLDPGAPSC